MEKQDQEFFVPESEVDTQEVDIPDKEVGTYDDEEAGILDIQAVDMEDGRIAEQHRVVIVPIQRIPCRRSDFLILNLRMSSKMNLNRRTKNDDIDNQPFFY